MRVLLVGCGNMGSALLAGARRARPADEVVAVDPKDAAREKAAALGARAVREIAEAEGGFDLVVLAVKPQEIAGALSALSRANIVTETTTVLSIAAGIPTSRIEAALPGARVVRAMPNTPALVGAGITAIAKGARATGEDLERVEAFLAGSGEVVRVEENDLDAVTAVSGSGPAYVFLLAEALEEAARAVGLSPDAARRLSVATVSGAGRLLAETGEDPKDLRRKVTSPGGTTEAALRVLSERGFAEALSEAVRAARDRSRELSR